MLLNKEIRHSYRCTIPRKMLATPANKKVNKKVRRAPDYQNPEKLVNARPGIPIGETPNCNNKNTVNINMNIMNIGLQG